MAQIYGYTYGYNHVAVVAAGGGGSNWILTTGFWDDAGVWDDSATWNG